MLCNEWVSHPITAGLTGFTKFTGSLGMSICSSPRPWYDLCRPAACSPGSQEDVQLGPQQLPAGHLAGLVVQTKRKTPCPVTQNRRQSMARREMRLTSSQGGHGLRKGSFRAKFE